MEVQVQFLKEEKILVFKSWKLSVGIWNGVVYRDEKFDDGGFRLQACGNRIAVPQVFSHITPHYGHAFWLK